MANTTEEDHDKDFNWLPIILAASFILAAWVFNLTFLLYVPSEQRGTFGDMFGAVNALFSGFAFLGVVVAILLQRKELELQRQELKDTRGVLSDQSDTIKKQRFEDTFFRMLHLLRETTGSIRKGSLSGPAVFKQLYSGRIHNWADPLQNSRKRSRSAPTLDQLEQHLKKEYAKFELSCQEEIGSYFRILYRIILYIDQECLFKNRSLYVSLLRDQLSPIEFLLLFVHGLGAGYSDRFKPLIEKYGLLDELSPERFRDHALLKRCVDLYSDSAYGDRAEYIKKTLSQ